MNKIGNIYFRAGMVLLVAGAVCVAAGCCPRRISLSHSVADSLSSDREVRYVERVRDTVIYVNVPVEVKEVQVRRDSSFLETSVAESFARINHDGSLSHTLENKPVEQPVTVTVKDRARNETASVGSVRTERVEVPVALPLTWVQKALIGCGIAFVSIVLGAAVFMLLRIFFRRRR